MTVNITIDAPTAAQAREEMHDLLGSSDVGASVSAYEVLSTMDRDDVLSALSTLLGKDGLALTVSPLSPPGGEAEAAATPAAPAKRGRPAKAAAPAPEPAKTNGAAEVQPTSEAAYNEALRILTDAFQNNEAARIPIKIMLDHYGAKKFAEVPTAEGHNLLERAKAILKEFPQAAAQDVEASVDPFV